MTDRSTFRGRDANEREFGRDGDDSGTLRTLLDSVADAVIVLDKETIAFANAAVEDVLGYEPSSLVGEDLSTLLADDRRAYREALELLRRTDDDRLALDELEVPVRDAAGDERWVELSLRAVEHGGRDLTTATLRAVSPDPDPDRRLERFRRIMETIDDGIYVLDSNFTITDVNDAMASMIGYDHDELVGSHASLLAADETLEEAARLSAELLETDRESATLTTEIRTANGETLPIETRFSLYPFGDERYGQVGVVRDITDRRRYEETLTALNESTRELLACETRTDVSRRIVDSATDVVDLSAARVYLFDRAANELQLAASADGTAADPAPDQSLNGEDDDRDGDRAVTDEATVDAADREPGEVPADGDLDGISSVDPEARSIGPADGSPWETFLADETTVATGDDPVLPGERGLYVPLGEHGLFVVATADEDVLDGNTRRLVDLLAASAEAALSRVDREREVREREAELQQQNRRLRQLDRVNAIIRELDQALVEAGSHEDIWRAVCDRLVADDRFAFAWIGDPNAPGDALEPQAWAGTGRGYLDDVSLALDGSQEPSVRAVERRAQTAVQNVGDDLRASPWRTAALSRDYRSVVSVPLLYGEHLYAVLTVYAHRPAAFDDMVQEVLAELGQTIANAMNAVETKRALLADSRVELALRLRDAADPLSRVARETGCELTVRGSIPEADGTARLFAIASGAPLDAVREAAEASVAVESIRLVADRDDEGLFEVVVAGEGLASTLTDHGASVRTITVDARGVDAVVDLPDDTAVRSFVEAVQARHPGTELVSRRRPERPARTPLEFRAAYEQRLTERQYEVLRVAYLSGFYERPRESTRQDIADSLGVSQPTINRHLRTCERTILEMLFDEA